MAHTFEVAFALGASLQSGFKASIGQAVSQVNKLGEEVRSLGNSKRSAEKFQAMTAKIEATRLEMVRARERARDLKKEFAAAEKPTKRLTQQMEAARRKSKQLKGKWKEQKASLQKLSVELKSAGVDTKNLSKEQDRLAKSYDRAKKSKERLGGLVAKQEGIRGRRDELRGQMLDAAAPVAAMALPVKLAIDFESEMADVKKVVDPKAFDGLGKGLLDMSTKIPMAVGGLAKITAAAGQSGLAKTKTELLDFAKTAATMGVAFDMAGGEAGSMMAAWRSGMKLSQSQAVGLADAVNHLSNNMNAQAGPLGEVLKRQGAVAKAAGLTEVQAASLGAALLSSGAPAEITATAMKNLTGALTKGSAATKAQRDAFDALGFDAEEMAARMQENAPDAIRSVFQALQDAPVEEQGALMSQLFGEESKGVIAPLLKNLDNLDKAFNLTADSTQYAGSMQKEYEVRSKTTAHQLQMLRNQGNRLGVSFGNVLLPGINAMIGPLGAVINKAAWLANTFPGITAGVGGIVAGLAGAGLAINAGAYAFTFYAGAVNRAKIVVAAFRSGTIAATIAEKARTMATWAGVAASKMAAAAQWTWNAALSAPAFLMAKARIIGLAVAQKAGAAATGIMTAAQWALNVALNANPIGLVVAGVGALAGAAYLVYKKWEPIKKFFADLWDKLKGMFGAAGKLFKFIPGLRGFFGGPDDESEQKPHGAQLNAGVTPGQTPTLSTAALNAEVIPGRVPGLPDAQLNAGVNIDQVPQFNGRYLEKEGTPAQSLRDAMARVKQANAQNRSDINQENHITVNVTVGKDADRRTVSQAVQDGVAQAMENMRSMMAQERRVAYE